MNAPTQPIPASSANATAVIIGPVEPAVNRPAKCGPYLLEQELGRGAMGAVFLATHEKLKRKVALKLLPPEFSADPRRLKRFHREMEAVGRLDHPNIVRATDAGEFNGTSYIAMDLVQGIDLEKIVRAVGTVDHRAACEIIRQAALGLQHIHENQLVHRDIKPSNLITTYDGQTKILDLGVARLHQSEQVGTLTCEGGLMGTPDYMSPEQVSDVGRVDIRADIYSLGCTFYTLLAGHAPFDGPEHGTQVAKIIAHTKETATDLTEINESLPPELATMVSRMMAKAPDDRFQTPREVADALSAWAAPDVLVATVAKAAESDTSTRPIRGHAASSRPAPMPIRPDTQTAKPRRIGQWIAFACIGLIGLGLFAWNGRSSKVADARLGSPEAQLHRADDQLLVPLQQVAENTREISSSTEALAATSEILNHNTNRIADTLDDIRDAFQAVSQNGGIVAHPDSEGELYHNAMVYARQGKNVPALESFEQILATGSDFVDVHQSIQRFLVTQSGTGHARDVYGRFPDFATSDAVRQWALAMLEEPLDQQRLLTQLADAHPEFGPALYHLGEYYAAADRGSQTLADKAQEKRWTERFVQAHQNGNVLRFFLDQREATELLDDARQRLVSLASLNVEVFENPVHVKFENHNQGWNVVFEVAEPASEIFFRHAGGEFKSTGFSTQIDSRTGSAAPNSYVSMPSNLKAGDFEVKYTDRNGQLQGPFLFPFEPDTSAKENAKRILQAIQPSWVQFGDGSNSNRIYFTQLSAYHQAIQEARIGLNEDPTEIRQIPDPKHSDANMQDLWLEVSDEVDFVTVQLTFYDGSTSEIVRIDRPRP